MDALLGPDFEPHFQSESIKRFSGGGYGANSPVNFIDNLNLIGSASFPLRAAFIDKLNDNENGFLSNLPNSSFAFDRVFFNFTEDLDNSDNSNVTGNKGIYPGGNIRSFNNYLSEFKGYAGSSSNGGDNATGWGATIYPLRITSSLTGSNLLNKSIRSTVNVAGKQT